MSHYYFKSSQESIKRKEMMLLVLHYGLMLPLVLLLHLFQGFQEYSTFTNGKLRRHLLSEHELLFLSGSVLFVAAIPLSLL
ncbi:hypothetical protein GQ55_1G243500 [Panicum hallii var. hallii]|uniref:Uncharacterized protein n=1 Tax=Panicum hallii var. hallii TaxID=1504633 RepID=A0A2T7F712_9POAL|nr:hypothetical protein GQ55_1G243500 [Panicum hallii var. hallii]